MPIYKLSLGDELGTNINKFPVFSLAKIPFKEELVRRLDSPLQDPIQMSSPSDFISVTIEHHRPLHCRLSKY